MLISSGWSANVHSQTHWPFRGPRCHGDHLQNICSLSQPLLSSPPPALLHLLNFSLSSFSASLLLLQSITGSPTPSTPVHRSLPPSLILYLSPSLLLPFISPPAIRSKPARFHSLSPLTLCAPSCVLLLLLLSLSLFSLLRCSPACCSLHSLRNQDQSGRRLTLCLEVRPYVCVRACVCAREGGIAMHCISTLEGGLNEWISEKGEMMLP